MTQPTITKKQQEIIRLIYRYRFVNRIQLQALMQLKDKKRLGVWLKDLREQHYLGWIYSTDFAEKTKPAIYYLSRNGVRFLRGLGEFPLGELHKRYKESSRTPAFIAKSILLVDGVLDMAAKTTPELTYIVTIRADYADSQHKYHFLQELNPDLYYERLEHTKAGAITKGYLIAIFDTTLPRYMVRKQLKDYVTYLYEGAWKRRFDCSELIVHIVCPTIAELAYAKRRTRLLLNDIGKDERTHIRFTTFEQVKTKGITGLIWEEV